MMWSATSLLEYHPDISIKENSINPISTLTLQAAALSSLNSIPVAIPGGSVSGNIHAIYDQPSFDFQSDIKTPDNMILLKMHKVLNYYGKEDLNVG